VSNTNLKGNQERGSTHNKQLSKNTHLGFLHRKRKQCILTPQNAIMTSIVNTNIKQYK